MASDDDVKVEKVAPPPPPPPPPPAPSGAGGKGGSSALGFLVLAVVFALPLYGIFLWFLCRIEVEQGKFVVLVAKTGADLPSGQIIAGPAQKGVRLETLSEGRHYRNPFFWDWYYRDIAEVPPGKVGVLVRLFGKEPPAGKILVDGAADGTEDPATAERGILRDVLGSGRYRINPFAYTLQIHDAVTIQTGAVGVVTNLVGAQPSKRNAYLVEPGERGVQKTTIGAGTHYLNPYATMVLPIDTRQRRFEFNIDPDKVAKMPRNDKTYKEMSDHVAIIFPSSDGFEIEVKLAVTWNVDPARAAECFVRVSASGDVQHFEEEVIHKVLTPVVRGYARIEGSKFEATQYISGASRSTFQHAMLEKIRAACGTKGVLVHEVLVSDIEPPGAIAKPIREREIAKEELARNQNQIKQAQSEQSLARQTALVSQQKTTVDGETKKIQRVIQARNQQEVAVIEQDKLLTVAKTDLEAAKAQASALISRGQAEADVIVAQNEAEAEGLKRSVEAFKNPASFASYILSRRMAPAVQGVFVDPASPFGRLFTDMLEPGSGAAK